jgi:hypothetical protein
VLAKAETLVQDPAAYEAWLKMSMAAHLVRLDIEARKGDVKAAQAFRIGALEVLEVLSAEEDEGSKPSPAASPQARGSRGATAAARAIAAAVGRAPEELVGSEGSGRQSDSDDEGRAGSDEPDQAVPD